MRILLFLLLPLIFLSSCMTVKQAERYCAAKTQAEIKDTTTQDVSVKDSIVYIEADSALLELYVECGDSNQIYLERIRDLKTKGLKTEVVIKEKIIYIRVDKPKQAITVPVKTIINTQALS